MANAPHTSLATTRYWTVPIGRAAIALVAAVLITFNQDHSASFGLLVFGGYAVLAGAFVALAGYRSLTDPRDRQLFLVQGAVGIVAGALALVFHAGGLGFFLFLVSVWGAVTGFLELYSGLRARRRVRGGAASSARTPSARTPSARTPSALTARDWRSMGALTAILALSFLLLPPNVVVSVGLLGAYLVIFGVYLIIAGLSLKWAATDDARPLTPASNESDTL
ncbi:MAG: DUF308 domain-containing protein [Cryobacterium sp.]